MAGDVFDPCADALGQLYHYIDGVLTTEQRDMVAIHLAECRNCDEIRLIEVEVRRVVATRCHETAPDSLRERIARALGGELG